MSTTAVRPDVVTVTGHNLSFPARDNPVVPAGPETVTTRFPPSGSAAADQSHGNCTAGGGVTIWSSRLKPSFVRVHLYCETPVFRICPD